MPRDQETNIDMALCSSTFPFSPGTLGPSQFCSWEYVSPYHLSDVTALELSWKQLNKMKPGKSCQRLQRMSEMAHMMGPSSLTLHFLSTQLGTHSGWEAPQKVL